MGHDLHFLQRLERVSLPHVELAMSLYQDPTLLQIVLSEAKIPDGAETVALSLDDPTRGPFVILTRAGRFVTCLGEDMRVAPGTPVITRSHLNSIADKVEDLRARIAQATTLIGPKGRVQTLLRRVFTAGDDLSREEFIAISAWQPLLRLEFLSQMMGSVVYLQEARGVLGKLGKAPKHHQALLREYWNVFWAIGHLALLVGAEARSMMESMPELREMIANGRSLSWGLTRQGFIPLALRGAWLVGKLGKFGLSMYKKAHEGAESSLLLTDSTLGLMALAVRHSGLRGEIRKLLLREYPEDGDAHDRFCRILMLSTELSTKMYFEDPETYRETIERLGRRTFLMLCSQLKENQDPTPEQLESVPEDLILPSLSWTPMCFFDDSDAIINLCMITPYAARAEAEDFYFPRAVLGRRASGWKQDRALHLLRSYRDKYEGHHKPIRVQPGPGRNDLCPCQSGKKFKRCCALAVKSQSPQ